ncbi:MAG: hypothetical protein J6M19_04745 [Bacteroidaceae bacterium]|nr:hypothetical protein [Bacteroidaceae bacterium]
MTINRIKKYILRAAAIALPLWGLGGFTSCEDMMTVDTGDKAYRNAQDTLYSYLGIMRAMQDVAERQVILGEIRGDLVTSTQYTTDTLNAISSFGLSSDKNYLLDRSENDNKSCSMLQVSDYYNVINNCNFYIHHADTNAVKSNTKYMIPEYAQVKAIRAWAYLQLVKNYKEVPFITEPVSNLSVLDNFDYAQNVVNKDNIVDKFIEDGLLNFVNTPYPLYGSASDPNGKWDNGYTSVHTRLMMIPINVLFGDMYLLRGASKSDYEKAAQYYYNYLKNETTPLYLQYCSAAHNFANSSIRYGSSGGWGNWANTYTYTASSNEVISLIPSSANAGLGKMLTRVADIYGYTPSSSQSTTTSENDAGETEVEAGGAITVTRNYKRQYAPSNAFQDVANHQTYVIYQGTTTQAPTVSYIENCDARYGNANGNGGANSTEELTYEGESYPLCSKAAKGAAFFYTIPIYRKTLIWLRLAEAINRAGYPEFAFAILKEGINQYSLPKIVDRYPEKYDEAGRLVYYSKNDDAYIYKDIETGIYYSYDEEGTLVEFDGSTRRYELARDTIANDSISYGTYGAMYYVTNSEQINKFNEFLNFSDDTWNRTYGIHARGTGVGSWTSANNEITTNISGYRDSVHYDYSKLLLAQGVDLENTPSQEDIINAVENIIVDELALETAFEGNRFTDLVRIAEHKNASGYQGTEWLAKKIANRGTKAATPTAAAVEGFDAALYTQLQNPTVWYFALPSRK